MAKRFGKARPSGEPSSSTERKIRILLELIRNKSVRMSRLCDDYGMAERSILRDFQELRKIGARAGFMLSDEVENDRMTLNSFDARPTSLDQAGKALHTLIRSAAKALGKPVEQELATLAGDERSERRFLRFMMPTLREDTNVGEVFKALENAWSANARVRFKYANKREERRVEPYAVLQHSGRYYLLGRDLAAKDRGWRHFALDQIRGPIARAARSRRKRSRKTTAPTTPWAGSKPARPARYRYGYRRSSRPLPSRASGSAISASKATTTARR